MQRNKRINKAFWSMLAFVTVGILVVVLLGFTVSADSYDMNFSKFNIENITRNGDIDDEIPIFINSTDTTYDLLWSIYSPSFQFNVDSSNDYSFIGNSSRYYIQGSGDALLAVYLPDNSYIIYDSSGFAKVYCTQADYDSFLQNHTESVQGNFYAEYTDFGYYSLPNTQTIDNDESRYARIPYFTCLSTNCPVYEVSDVDSYSSYSDFIGSNKNPNYDDNQETAENNLYFKDAYWTWTTYKNVNDNVLTYNWNLENINRGRFSLDYTLNDYQEDHKDEFTLVFDFTVNYNVDTVGNEPDSYNKTYSIEQPLNSVNASSIPFTFNGLFNSTQFYTWWSSHHNTAALELDHSSFIISATVKIRDNRGHTSKALTDNYDVINNKAKRISNGITYNDNPYVPTGGSASSQAAEAPTVQTGTGVINDPNSSYPVGTTGSGTGSMYVDNRFTVNNNPTATVDYVKDNLLPTTAGEDGFTEKLAGVTESNRFINYMSSTFSFIPQSFFENLSTYFYIFLGVLVAYFVLRLLLDIL